MSLSTRLVLLEKISMMFLTGNIDPDLEARLQLGICSEVMCFIMQATVSLGPILQSLGRRYRAHLFRLKYAFAYCRHLRSVV